MGKRESVYDITGGRCFYCGRHIDFENFHMDHFKAQKLGGKQKNNLVPACADCNIAKSDMTIEQFRERIGNMLNSTLNGRMICKFYGVSPKPIKFFFEEVDDGFIQDNINEFLDR